MIDEKPVRSCENVFFLFLPRVYFIICENCPVLGQGFVGTATGLPTTFPSFEEKLFAAAVMQMIMLTTLSKFMIGLKFR